LCGMKVRLLNNTNALEKAAIRLRRDGGRVSDFRPALAKRGADRGDGETEAGENEDDRNYNSPAAISEDGERKVNNHAERVEKCLGHGGHPP